MTSIEQSLRLYPSTAKPKHSDKLKTRYQPYLRDRKFLISSAVSLLFLIFSFFINYQAGTYATESQSSPVSDVILSNTPVFDVTAIFHYGSIIMVLFIALMLIWYPKSLPFGVKSIALFIIVRSISISLTHIGAFPLRVDVSSLSLIDSFTFGGDLFFSGHTGMPFLMALVFWENKQLRYAFIAISIFMGAIVLLGHLHYTIDVFSAFFITYTIFHIAKFLFKKDYRILSEKSV